VDAEALSKNGSSPVTLALDIEGGDLGPAEALAGALAVASPKLRVLAVGRPEVVRPLLLAADAPAVVHVELLPCDSVISFHDEPARAIRNRPESSIAVGARAVVEGRAQGFVSAGNTGAMLAAGLLIVRRLEGVKRPAILTVLPGAGGPVVLVDSGANADCRPEHLVEFAIMGAVFARLGLGIVSPRIGLLNIGEEASKGNELARSAHALLLREAKPLGLDFVGNVEGRDMLSEKTDVIVTDGFTGNVALKLLEGTASSLFGRIREAAGSSTRAKLGGLLMRSALRGLRSALDPEEYGGAYLLGVRGLLVICHGNSSRRAIANALRFGQNAVEHGIVPGLQADIERLLATSPDVATMS
jgi:glycerol-3-phosphate acyltransferase PlsX